MDPAAHALDVLRCFVVGNVTAEAFEQHLYRDPELESLLSQVPAPAWCQTGTTLFHYLIGLDWRHPGQRLDAQAVLSRVLDDRGIAHTACTAPADEHRLILAAQPRWLDADSAYLATLLAAAPPGSPRERTAWLRQRILELFRYRARPPRWLQAPRWPIGASGPMVFLGQLAVDGYLHDRAVAYVFHDPATGECTTVLQTA